MSVESFFGWKAMVTYEEMKRIKTLWKGKPQTVSVHIGLKAIHVGWTDKKEAPLKEIEYDPNKDGLMLFVDEKHCATITLVTGSATFHNVKKIKRRLNAIQLFI